MKQVLILCTGNSCRSQMAEGLWQSLGQGLWRAHSAGSKPTGQVHPLAIVAMQEIGIDISCFRSKHVDEFKGQPFEIAVTVCDNARDSCPIFPSAMSYVHWPFDDPAHAKGNRQEQLIEFRRVRDEIRNKISKYLAE